MKAVEVTTMRALYWRSVLLLLWMAAIVLAIGALPRHA